MSKAVLDGSHFHDEYAAYGYLEARIWPNGPVCPRCGQHDRIGKMGGKSTRIGVYKCYKCRKPFRATVGTVFESSHIPLRLWLQAVHLMASSKKGIGSNQLHRVLGVTLKTAWFMSHRIREAMRIIGVKPIGGAGETVEMDETSSGWPEGFPRELKEARGWQNRNVVFTLVQRGGSARSFHIESTTVGQLIPIIRANVAGQTAVMTDSASWYKFMNKEGAFASHDRVDHTRGEYVRYGERLIHTNTVEGYYSVFKRGMKGVYQHCNTNPQFG